MLVMMISMMMMTMLMMMMTMIVAMVMVIRRPSFEERASASGFRILSNAI